MNIRELAGKKICILGYGKEGQAMAEAIEKYAGALSSITIADKSEGVNVPGKYLRQLGEAWCRNLDAFDVLIKSPGIPRSSLPSTKTPLTSPTQIFLETIRPSGALVIGVTGSKGKSTTASLLDAILKEAGKDSHLIGNIGEPAIRHLHEAKPGAIFVMELSSYQLLDLSISPDIAVVTSFFPEHLDYHGSVEAYLDAKKNIARFQPTNGVVFFSEASEKAKEIAEESKGKHISFSEKQAVVKLSEIQLRGQHNLSNIAGALSVALHLGIDKGVALDAIRKFKGLMHRLETVKKVGGIEWVNDSISTTPESATAALNALGQEVRTIIVGGHDRGYDFSVLAKRLKTSHVETVILLPDSGFVIAKAIEREGVPVLLVQANDMSSAVRLARSHTEEGIILLSPASPSYGHFKNFEDRGQQFKDAIEALTEEKK